MGNEYIDFGQLNTDYVSQKKPQMNKLIYLIPISNP